MKRDVLLIPTNESASGIERVRKLHDPLAGKVPAHVTLLFPEAASALPARLLEQVAGTNLPSIASILFSEVTAAADGTIWLTPEREAGERLLTWHERLFVALGRSPSAARPYWPHMTLGRFLSGAGEQTLEEVHRQLHLPILLRFSHLLLEEFDDDDLSQEVARLVVG